MKTYHFSRKKFTPVTASQFNSVIRRIKARAGKIHLQEYHKILYERIGFDGYLVDKLKFVELTCLYDGEYQTFVFDKATGKPKNALINAAAGMNAYACCRRMLGENNNLIPNIVPDEILNEYGKNVLPFSASPILYKNDKYEYMANKAVGYDMNSAYSFAMLQDMPDTRCIKTVKGLLHYNEGIVTENLIGFNSNGELVPVGEYAIYRFKKIPSPFRHFIEYYYNMKKNAKKPEERERAKRILNLAVGYFQRTNPFIRAAIVSGANNLIRSLMDENTIYCNTDSIVSLKRRPELEIGDGIGQWKIEHKGIFKYEGMNYQWNNELPAYRGVPKEWFPKKWDLLKDPLPINGNLYELDVETYLIKRVVKEAL